MWKYYAKCHIDSDESNCRRIVYTYEGGADTIEGAIDILREWADPDVHFKLYVVDKWGKIVCDITEELLGKRHDQIQGCFD